MTVVHPGEPLVIKAADWNAATAAGLAVANNARSQRLEMVDPKTRAPALLRIRNDSAVQFDRYDVVELTDPVITPTESLTGWQDGLPAINAVTPTAPAADIRGRIAILLEPIGPGKIGLAVVSGAVRTKLTLNSPTDTHAAPVAGSLLLGSTTDNTAPCEILWAEDLEDLDEPAEVWALVRISNWHAMSTKGACLAEQHPGRGVPFDATLGVWNPATDGWDYIGATIKCIDWRYGVPYPEAGATGLFTQRPSATYGTIWECVSLDCSSPGEPCYGDPPT
jgi:hypothetical protein